MTTRHRTPVCILLGIGLYLAAVFGVAQLGAALGSAPGAAVGTARGDGAHPLTIAVGRRPTPGLYQTLTNRCAVHQRAARQGGRVSSSRRPSRPRPSRGGCPGTRRPRPAVTTLE